MFPYSYSELNKQYNYLVKEASSCIDFVPRSNEPENFIAFYIEVLQLNFLTKMMLLEPKIFNYYKELNALFSDVVYWLNNRLNFSPYNSNAKMGDGYDKYIVLKALLDDDCELFWHKKIKKSFIFLFKKIHYPTWITRWVMDSAYYAEENGYYYFSWLFSKNLLAILDEHGELTKSLKYGIVDCYNRGVEYMKRINRL